MKLLPFPASFHSFGVILVRCATFCIVASRVPVRAQSQLNLETPLFINVDFPADPTPDSDPNSRKWQKFSYFPSPTPAHPTTHEPPIETTHYPPHVPRPNVARLRARCRVVCFRSNPSPVLDALHNLPELVLSERPRSL